MQLVMDKLLELNDINFRFKYYKSKEIKELKKTNK